jgi:hypothetical protein
MSGGLLQVMGSSTFARRQISGRLAKVERACALTLRIIEIPLTACPLHSKFSDKMASASTKTTLLDLLVKLQREDQSRTERTLVTRALRMVRSGRVVLCGIFADSRLK